jgi:hypothetical protein
LAWNIDSLIDLFCIPITREAYNELQVLIDDLNR